MTESVKSEVIEAPKLKRSRKKKASNDKRLKSSLLNCLFRDLSIVDGKDNLRAISDLECKVLSSRTEIKIPKIRQILDQFYSDLTHFKAFLREGLITYSISDQARKVRIYLHKVHKLAPVFDYKRARENAKRLKLRLDQILFWPQVMTQVAIIIYVTDYLDKNRKNGRILQRNLRALCDSSAYAFHRTRNKIGLRTMISNSQK